MNAIECFQQKIGATVDGDLGPNTMKKAMSHFNWTSVQAAHFFGQCCHETGHFKTFVENLNYSAKGLRVTFPKYFPTDALAIQYQRNPEKIANRVYANRMGNRDESSGDGYKYRGRGSLQLTGADNYKAFSEFVKDPDIMVNPDRVATEYAFESAMFFFSNNALWKVVGVNDVSIEWMTRRINGGVKGLNERSALTYKYYKSLVG